VQTSIFDDPGLFGRLWADTYDEGEPDLFNLVREQRQRDCFRNVARVLASGGAFVIETFVPDSAGSEQDEQVQVREVTEDSATIRMHQHDRAAQTVVRQTIRFDSSGVHLGPFAMRYCWPEQIDEMAQAAGLRLTERCADWHRQPFGPTSKAHISVYRRD
jgi:hypothetical protein